MNKKIILAGLANSKTSLGEVFRRYYDCFKQFSNPDVYDFCQFIDNEGFKLDIFPQYEGKIDHDIKYFHTTFHLYRKIKNQTKPKQKSDSKKIGYFVWESSELHDQDAEVLHDFDEIWTASSYCKSVFAQYIDPSKIKIVPHPIPTSKKKIPKYKTFTILIIGNISSNVDRKNIIANLEVAKRIKRANKNVNIIFKTFTVSQQERNLLATFAAKGVKIIDEYYSYEKVERLIAKSHVILSLHRSEGFGLTLAEAMNVGTIPLATGYSGNLDFITDSRLLVDYKLIDVQSNYFKGQWAEPSLQDAVDKLNNIIANPSQLYDLSHNLTPEKISNQIKTLII